jgi:hypothetical protein
MVGLGETNPEQQRGRKGRWEGVNGQRYRERNDGEIALTWIRALLAASPFKPTISSVAPSSSLSSGLAWWWWWVHIFWLTDGREGGRGRRSMLVYK